MENHECIGQPTFCPRCKQTTYLIHPCKPVQSSSSVPRINDVSDISQIKFKCDVCGQNTFLVHDCQPKQTKCILCGKFVAKSKYKMHLEVCFGN